MAIPNTPKPAFPNVPQVPGAPIVPRSITSTQTSIVGIASSIARIVNIFFPPQWGLYTTDGSPVLTASDGLFPSSLGSLNRLASVNGLSRAFSGNPASVKGIEFRREKRISTAPQEEGAFLSYNKVSDPFQAKITYLQGGSDADRRNILNQVNTALNVLDLFMLVMPDMTYPSVNVVHYDFNRTSRKGMTLLEIDVWVEQVRVVGTAQFSKTETPAGASPTNGGTVQPETPSAASGVPAHVSANGLPAGAVT